MHIRTNETSQLRLRLRATSNGGDNSAAPPPPPPPPRFSDHQTFATFIKTFSLALLLPQFPLYTSPQIFPHPITLLHFRSTSPGSLPHSLFSYPFYLFLGSRESEENRRQLEKVMNFFLSFGHFSKSKKD